MGNALRIGRIFGIDIKIDASWFIVFFLVTWSLADHYFPTVHPGWQPITYWSMSIVSAVLFFSSVVAHELSHSFVSQAFGVPVRDITLFIFGGVARISEEPHRAREELLMALAGPAMSLTLAGLFGLLWSATGGANEPIHALTGWLAVVNLSVGLFNLVPGFPLDGGRVFRAVVWSLNRESRARDPDRSRTRTNRRCRIHPFGHSPDLCRQLGQWTLDRLHRLVPRKRGRSHLRTACATAGFCWTHRPRSHAAGLPGDSTPSDAGCARVDQVILPSGRRCFPVVERGRLEGLLTLHRIKAVPRDRWPLTHVEEAMIPRTELKTVKPSDDLNTVFDRMVSEDVNQFPVVDDGRFFGIVARDGLLSFIRTRAEVGVDRLSAAGK